jgi:hypothetical protein
MDLTGHLTEFYLPTLDAYVYLTEKLVLALERFHIDHEPISNVDVYAKLVSLVHFLSRD